MDDMATPDKSYEKKREVMKKRLASLGKDNPVVAKAMKNQEPPQEDKKWKKWNIVDELVSAARREYFDKESASLNQCVANLAKALSKLGSKRMLTNEYKK